MAGIVPLVLGGLILWFFTVLFFIQYIRNRTSQTHLLQEVQDGVNRILTEVDRITEEDVRLIEERERKLKTILEEADRRIQVFLRELDRKRRTEQTYTDLGKSRPLPVERAEQASSRSPGVEAGQPVEPAGSAGSLKMGGGPSGKRPPREPKSMGERARDLHELGLSTRAIASKLGVSITEVELILALHKPRR